MGLLSFLKRDAEAASPSQDPSSASVQSARTRARQRLIGALVLLSIGVIGFPLLFESQPRPIPVDLPISIPSKDNAPALPMPSPRTSAAALPPVLARGEPAPDIITETQADAGREVRPPAAASQAPVVAASRPAARPASAAAKPADRPAVAPPSATASVKPAAVAAANPAEAARARALLNGGTAAKPAAQASQAAAGRYIVQIGAFADAALAREARLKVEKLGLKTYTHVAQTPGGQRIRVRVGPFAERAEADRASARLRSAGLPAALLTL